MKSGRWQCPRCGWQGELTPKKAAEMITNAGVGTGPDGRCSAQTIRNMCRDGRIPGAVMEMSETVDEDGAHRITHYWVPPEWVEEFIREQIAESAA